MFSFEQAIDIFAPAQDGVTLIQISEVAREPMVVARALAHLTGIPALDLAPLVRKRHGPIVLENLLPALAEVLTTSLSQAGLEVRQVPSALVVVPRLLGNVIRLDYGDEGIHVGVHDHDLQIPWTAVALISVAWVEMPQGEREFREEPVDGEHYGEVRKREKTEKAFLADLFFAVDGEGVTPGVSYVRLLSRHLPYAHLGERLKPASLENFRTVLQDICENAPDHQLNDNCRRFLSGEVLPPMVCYHSIEAFDEENLKLLKLPW